MTDNDTMPAAPAPERPKRKYVRRYPPKRRETPRQPPELKVVPRAPDEFFTGMTNTLCAGGCSEAGCIITGDVCGHPYKSGLQPKHYMLKAVMDRYERAKDFLKHQAIDKQRKEA